MQQDTEIDQHYTGAGASQMNAERNKLMTQTSSDPYVTLGNIAREKWNQFQVAGKPLEDKYIAQVGKEGAQFKEDAAAAEGRNAAIRSLGPISTSGVTNSNQLIRGLDGRQVVMGASTATAAQKGAEIQRNKVLQDRVNVVNLGRGIQSKGSNMMVANAAREIGAKSAYDYANTQGRLATQEMFGTVAGAGVGAYGQKAGWFD